MGLPQKEWFILKNPIKLDDFGVPPFQETFISAYAHRWPLAWQMYHYHWSAGAKHRFSQARFSYKV